MIIIAHFHLQSTFVYMKRRLRVFSCAKLIFTLIIEFDVPRSLFRCSPVCAIRPRNRKLETGRIPRLRILVCFDNPAPKIHAGCNLGPQINGFVGAIVFFSFPFFFFCVPLLPLCSIIAGCVLCARRLLHGSILTRNKEHERAPKVSESKHPR